MSAVNTDLSRFAVFVNSKSAVYPSLSKSDVIIPFTANLADHDPLKVMKVSITDVLFSNVFYNIRPNVCTLKTCDLWAAGRNKSFTYTVKTVSIPYGYYNYDTFTDYCNSGGSGDSGPGIGFYLTRTMSGGGSLNVFYGFGSKYAGLTTNNIDASAYSLTLAKIWAQTPTLGDMFQSYLSDSTVTITGSQSGIYAGKYLIVDEETYPLMHLLGFSHQAILEAPDIPGTPYKGLGYPIYSRESGGNTQYSFDNLNWGTSTADATFKSLVPMTVSDFTGLDDLYIHCEQMRTQFMSSQGRSPLSPNDVVCVVPVSVAYGEKMSFVPNFPLESYLVNTNITQLRFRMTNSNNEELDFKGINWSLTMYCEEVDDEARIAAENGPPGNLPQTFFTNGIAQTDLFMQARLKQAAKKRSLNGLM
jgi:hypothetical protein